MADPKNLGIKLGKKPKGKTDWRETQMRILKVTVGIKESICC